MNPYEAETLARAYGMAEAAMARAWAVEEVLLEFALEVKHPEGLPLEVWRQKMQTLQERVLQSAAERIPAVQAIYGCSSGEEPAGPARGGCTE